MAPALTTLHASHLLQKGHLPSRETTAPMARLACLAKRGGNLGQLPGPFWTCCLVERWVETHTKKMRKT